MAEMADRVMLALSNAGLDDVTEEDARAAIEAMLEPTQEQLAIVVQQVGDPGRENWQLAEQVCTSLSFPSMEGETAVAELARDWNAMITAALGKE